MHPTYSSIEGVLFDKSQAMLVAFPGGRAEAYAIPESVTTIGEGAFYGCRRLTEVVIPEGATAIRPEAFCKCASR